MRRTFAARVTALVVVVTLASLALLVVIVAISVDSVLLRKTNQLLENVAARANAMLDAAIADDLTWADAELEELRPPDVRLEVRSLDGATHIAIGPALWLGGSGEGCRDRGTVRVCGRGARRTVLVVGRDRSDNLAARHRLIAILVFAAGAVAMLAVVSGRAMARRAVLPLTALAGRVETLEPGTGERVASHSGVAEVNGLAQAFDDLVERFEEALAREKRFAAEASHELRTPLTVARAEVEALILGDTDAHAATRALAAVDGLGALVDRLLWFARAGERLDERFTAVVNVTDALREELAAVARAHPDRLKPIDLPDEALVRGDETLLRRTLANLLDNAVRHGEGRIEVRVNVADEVCVYIASGGTPIPPEQLPQLFQPFARGGARSPGFGLGLAFVRTVARSHGGDVELRGLAQGNEVILHLPQLRIV